MLCHSKSEEMASEVVNASSLVEARETQIEDAHEEETCAEEIQVHDGAVETYAEIDAHDEKIQVQIPIMLRV